MIRVYFLPVETIHDAESVAGLDLIHDAILKTTENPTIRKLIMNTTDDEDNSLSNVCVSAREALPDEIALYLSQVTIEPPNPDIVRASELLSTSPQVITQPQIWELLRIFGKLHGIP